MRKTLALLLSFLVLGHLSAQVFSSNMLGQRLEVISAVPQSGYALEVEGPVSTLYLDGVPVRRTERIEGQTEALLAMPMWKAVWLSAHRPCLARRAG